MSHSAKKDIKIQRFLTKFLPEQVVRKINILSNNNTSLILIRDQES